MSFEEKMDNAKNRVAGKAKEIGGKVTGNKECEAEGKAQGMMAKVKDNAIHAKENIEETADNVKDSAKGFVKGAREDSQKEIDK